MSERKVNFGPGAASLILIVVMLAMSVLGLLTLMSARNDRALSLRSAEAGTQVAELFAQSEERYAELDALFAECAEKAKDDAEYLRLIAQGLAQQEGVEMDGRAVQWQEVGAERTLSCELTLSPWGESPRAYWTNHQLTVYLEETWD